MKRDFTRRLFSDKTVAVWGVGYLGYTTALRLQSQGFNVLIHDFNPDHLERLRRKEYPHPALREQWARTMEIPSLRPEKTILVDDIREMFAAPVHCIGFPPELLGVGALIEAFASHAAQGPPPLLVFLAAETPGSVRKRCIEPMRARGLSCSFAVAFREDWALEEFFRHDAEQVVAGQDAEALEQVRLFLSVLNVPHLVLPSIEEAEIFENARRTLRFTLTAFVNQLSMAFPGADIRHMAGLLAKNCARWDVTPGMGGYEFKIESAIRHFLDGAGQPQWLSLIREAQSADLAMMMHHGDLIARTGASRVTILGLSSRPDLKDIRFSPSQVLAEYLHRQGMEVTVHDPFFTAEEVANYMPYARYAELDALPRPCEVVVLMIAHGRYRALSVKDLTAMGVMEASLVLDNTGLLERVEFPATAVYRLVGAGGRASAKK